MTRPEVALLATNQDRRAGPVGLTNVIKHAQATVAILSAVRCNGSLFVSITDNGIGGATPQAGSGLAGLADRLDAPGGRLLVRSDPAGTLVTAELPCA